MRRPYRVGIVGCGVAGATTAYLLARDGCQVTVLERADILRPVGAGVLLQSSGQEILRRLGILDKVTSRAAPLDELYARQVNGRTLIRTRYTDLDPSSKTYGVHRGVLFNALHDLVRSQFVEVRRSCEIIAREVRRNGDVALLDACGQKHGPFDFVIAADGSLSQLRAACGLRAIVTNYTHGTLWVVAPGAGVPGKLLQVVRGTRFLFGLLPLGDGLVTMYWGLPLAQYKEVESRGLDKLKEEILAFSPEAEQVLSLLVDWSQLLLTSYRHVYMPRWYDPWTLFIGDACHAMSPHLGQGINLAMVDAWRLAECLRNAPNPHSAFQTFRQRQRAYIRYYALVTYLLSPFFQSDWPILGLGRDWGLPILPWIPWVKRQMLLTVTGMKGGFLKGRITL